MFVNCSSHVTEIPLAECIHLSCISSIQLFLRQSVSCPAVFGQFLLVKISVHLQSHYPIQDSEFYLCFYTINTKGLEMRHYSNSKNEKRTGATSSPSSCVISLEIVLSLSRNPQANNCPYLFSLTIHSRKNGSSIS